MKKFIITYLIFGMLLPFSALASEITIFTDVSRASNEVRVYLKNTSNKSIVVLTKNLTVTASGDQITLSPDRHVVILNNQMITLKEDIAHYGALTLKPDEITYIHRPNIHLKTGAIIYKINEKWAKLHDVWAGTAQTKF